MANIDAISPWRFKAPLSPDMAARRENREINFSDLLSFCAQALSGPEDVKIIEGIGGLMVPLTSSHTVLDWIDRLKIPVVVVVGSYLGSISHTLTTVSVIEAHGIEIAEIVVNESLDSSVELGETIEVLKRFLPKQKTTFLQRSV